MSNRERITQAQSISSGRQTKAGKSVPLSAAEVTGATGVGLSIALGCSPKEKFRGSRTPSMSRIASLCSSTLSLSYLVCGVFTLLLRVRSVSHRNLELFDTVSEQGRG